MAKNEYKAELREMSNAKLLDEVDAFFGYDGYYADLRALITKELERRLGVAVDKNGKRFDRKRCDGTKVVG